MSCKVEAIENRDNQYNSLACHRNHLCQPETPMSKDRTWVDFEIQKCLHCCTRNQKKQNHTPRPNPYVEMGQLNQIGAVLLSLEAKIVQ